MVGRGSFSNVLLKLKKNISKRSFVCKTPECLIIEHIRKYCEHFTLDVENGKCEMENLVAIVA